MDGLPEGLWPIHTKPLPDELLSSWLIRLAHAHQLKAETLCSDLFGHQSTIWNRDVDRLAPEWVLTGLCRATGTALSNAKTTTLPSLAGQLSESVSPGGFSPWIIPLGIFHRSRLRPGLMYCPVCLAEEHGRYYRRLWRIAWATVCIKHRCLLQDTCPACTAPIAPHRTDMSGRGFIPTLSTLISCHACQYMLPQQAATPADNGLVTFQALLENALTQGFTDLAGNPSLHSVLFFNGLRALLTGGLRAMGRNDPTHKGRNPTFESRPLLERRKGIQLLRHWLDRWPHTFQAEIIRLGFRYSELNLYQGTLPYWYYQVVHPLAKHPAAISEQEAEAVMDVLVQRHGKRSLQAAKQLAGKDISATWHHSHPKYQPTYDDLENAVVTIDHRIAGTLNPDRRLRLLRAKFMLVARYGLHLTTSALASLSLTDISRLDLAVPMVSFYEVPISREQSVAWLLWYWQHIRPLTKPVREEKKFFTDLGTGKGLSVSTCSLWTKITPLS